jgi:uncharacterized membrane protein (UPF0127 family)
MRSSILFPDMRHGMILASLLAAVACGGSKDTTAPPGGGGGDPPIPKAITVSFPGGTVSAEIAALTAARNTGLMNRTSIAADSGMIFVWATDRNPQFEGFYMLNTHFDLSVAFLDSQKRVINVEDMTAETTAIHYATAPYRYAVEARKGWFASHGVVAGTTATFTVPAGVIIDP